jgi:hypothetical protein
MPAIRDECLIQQDVLNVERLERFRHRKMVLRSEKRQLTITQSATFALLAGIGYLPIYASVAQAHHSGSVSRHREN